ncbi:MAG: sodium/solute symporter [Planctomycetes bacterium]|nr:sodium/solute symporter [Planctomycetota bacterium]
MSLAWYDGLIFFAYLAATVSIGYLAGRGEKRTARQYFLAGGSLPWYAVGLSMIATSISTEQYIGEVGFAYTAGLSVGNWELGVMPAFLILVWFLLPLYLRRRIFTIPEYLEQRFGPGTRGVFAIVTLFNYAFINLAGVIYLGGFALQKLFGLPLYPTAFALAVLTGGYSIYGGLRSVVWTDVLQGLLLLTGGLLVFLFGMSRLGWDIGAVVTSEPSRAHLIAPLSHDHFPWTGALILIFSTNVWYCCTNQFYIQRCLGARSLWDGRAGVLLACALGIVLFLCVCVPGLIAHAAIPGLADPNEAFLRLVTDVLPAGLHGIIFAALVAAIMSTISSLVNSTATLFSIDVYKRLIRPETPDAALMRVGRASGAFAIVLACAIAPLVGLYEHIFLYFQEAWAVLAIPPAVVFTMGALWRRATPRAAFATMLLTITYLPVPFIWRIVPAPRMHFFTFAAILWGATYIFFILATLLSRDPRAEEHGDLVWRPALLRALRDEASRPWYRGIGFWSAVVAALFIAIYAALW